MNLKEFKQKHKNLQLQNCDLVFFRKKPNTGLSKTSLLKNKELFFFLSQKENGVWHSYLFGTIFCMNIKPLNFFYKAHTTMNRNNFIGVQYNKIIFNQKRLKIIAHAKKITEIKRTIMAQFFLNLRKLSAVHLIPCRNLTINIQNAPRR